jgi:hypothetical protein
MNTLVSGIPITATPERSASYLSNDADAAADDGSFCLRAAHAAES